MNETLRVTEDYRDRAGQGAGLIATGLGKTFRKRAVVRNV